MAKDRPRTSAPDGPEPVTLDSLESALTKLADNPSLRHQAPELAKLVIEVERVHKLSPDEPSPGRQVEPSAPSRMSDAADAATSRVRAEVGR